LTISALPAGACNRVGSGAASEMLADGIDGAAAGNATGAGTICGATAITGGLVLHVETGAGGV
jgi:hypothetical protein